jgi:hypothetical protein
MIWHVLQQPLDDGNTTKFLNAEPLPPTSSPTMKFGGYSDTESLR